MTNPKRPGRWKAGESGNPAGRKPGKATRHATLRAGLDAHVPAIIQQLTTAALAGDVGAARLILERCVPALRPVELPVAVDMPPDGTLSEQSRAVLAAVAAAELPAGTAATLLQAMSATARVLEVDELARRVAALEDSRKGAP